MMMWWSGENHMVRYERDMTGDRRRGAGWLTGMMMAAMLSGCVAQQADLKQAERDLQKKIKQSSEELAQTRARQSQEISSIREQELPKLQGDLDKALHKAKLLETRQDDLQAKLESRIEKRTAEQDKRAADLDKRLGWVEKQLVDQDAQLRSERERLKTELAGLSANIDQMRTHLESVQKAVLEAVQATTGNLAKKIETRLDEQQKALHAGDVKATALSQQLDKLNRSLGDYKQALTGLGEKLVRQEEATSQLSASLSQQTAALSKRADALAAKVEADTKASTTHINEVNKALTGHLADVNKSVASVAKALETAGGKFMARVDEQDRRLDELAGQLRSTGKSTLRQQIQKPAHRSVQAPAQEQSKAAQDMTEAPGPSSPETEEAPATSPSSEPAAEPAPVAAAERSDRDAYGEALNRFKEGDLDRARQSFAAFLADFPNSELAPNARYWLGESYYGKKEFKQAIDAYDRVELDYPQSEKVPAALLKKGYAYLALKDRKRASSAFKQVVTLYPKSPEAGKASDKLSQLKESH